MRKLLFAAALAAGALMAGGVATAGAADTTVTVKSKDTGNNWYSADTRAPGTGTFEVGPATPPLGNGSFELNTPDNTAKVQLFTDLYDGVALDDIDGIGYSTYRDPLSTGFSAGVAALNLRVDFTEDGQPDAYLVYEPYQDQGNAAVLTGAWQNWDAYQGGNAKWWISGSSGCGQSSPCTWSEIVDNSSSDLRIEEGLSCGPGATPKVPCPGSLGVNQGSFNAGIISNADALYVSTGGNKTTYNFDAAIGPPTSKNACKDGGWATFDTPRAFKNQGDCVSFVANGK